MLLQLEVEQVIYQLEGWWINSPATIIMSLSKILNPMLKTVLFS